MAAHFIDIDTGSFRELAPPDAALETHCGYGWSPDGRRIACEIFGVKDSNRNGIYSMRASDGGGLARITSTQAATTFLVTTRLTGNVSSSSA
jgi:hypothetical protein